MRVFIDTTILRHAVGLTYGSEARTVEWGGHVYQWKAPRLVPKPKRDVWLEGEMAAIREVATAARRADIVLVITAETQLETFGFPQPLLMYSSASALHEIEMERATAPFHLDRIIASYDRYEEHYELLQQALDSAPDERYQLIRRVVGKEKAMDAYHLCCAEHAHCKYFLTTDKRFVNSIRHEQFECQSQPVFPSELVGVLSNNAG